jgi:hypothetical protein
MTHKLYAACQSQILHLPLQWFPQGAVASDPDQKIQPPPL